MKKQTLIYLLFVLLSVISCKKSEPEQPSPQPTPNVSLGLQPTPQGALQAVAISAPINFSGTVPASFSLETPPPEEQGQGSEGSCVAWACAYGTVSYHFNKSYFNTDGSTNYGNVGSPEYLYNQIKVGSCDGGSYFVDNQGNKGALDELMRQGVCTWKDMPYNSGDCNTQPNSTQKQIASSNRIQKYERITNFDPRNLKVLLLSKFPIIIGATLDNGFMNANKSFVWKSRTGNNVGNHAMVVVGYDDAKNAFKLLNSWGKNWADNGYTWVDYNYFSSVVFEAYITYKGNNDTPVPPQPQPTDDLTKGLVLYLPFSGNAQDASGNGNHGTVNGASLTTDRKGNVNSAYNFDGVSSYIEVKDHLTLRPKLISICAWARTTQIGTILGKSNFENALNEQYALSFNNIADICFSIKQNSNCASGGYDWQEVTTNVTVKNNQWHYVIATFDGITMKCYVDGVLKNIKSNLPKNEIDNCSGGNIRIGKWWLVDPLFFKGQLDEIRIYNRALSDAEVLKLYQQ